MVVAEWNARIQAQSGLELTNGVFRAIGVLVGTPQEHVGQGVGGLDLDGPFQFATGGEVVFGCQEHESQIKVDTEVGRAEFSSVLEFFPRV